jgi:hypothetical protein
MDGNKETETPQAVQRAGYRDWERLLLGNNGIEGTIRLVLFAVLFALVFGSLFHVLG